MKKRIALIIQLIIVAVLLLAPVGIVLAAYSMDIIVTNDSATDFDMVGCNITANVDYWETQGFIATGGTDCRMYSGGTAAPFMLVDDRIMIAVDLPAQGSAALTMTTDSVAQDFQIIPGYGGYITVTDAANLELGSNFSIDIDGVWIDTDSAASKHIFYKQNAIDLYVSDDTDEKIIGAFSFDTDEIVPNGAGDATGIMGVIGAATHWDAVNEVYGSPSDAEYVWTNNGSEEIDYYNLEAGSVPAGSVIDSVTVYFRAKSAVSTNIRPYLRLSGTNTVGSTINPTASYVTYNEALARPGGGDWAVSDIASLQVGIGMWGAVDVYCSQVSVVIAYHSELSVTGIASGEYDVILSANTTHISLDVSGTSDDAVLGSAIPDNANNIILMAGDGAIYCDNITIDVSGTEQLLFSPNDILVPTANTAVLPDRGSDGTNNAGTITLGDNPTDVDLSLGSFESDYSVDTAAIEESTDIAPVIQTRMIPASEAAKLASLSARDKVLYPFFSAINGLTTPGIPILMMYEIFFLTITVAVMFVLGRFGHLFIMVIAGLALMGFATAWGVFDFPLIILLVLIGGGFIYMQGRAAP